MRELKSTSKAQPKKAPKREPKPQARQHAGASWVGRVPPLKPGTYADGLPIHEVEYLCCKLILRPNHFVSRESLFEFAEVMRAPAKEHGVVLSTKGFHAAPLKIREVLFGDTHDFRLYNNAFILRRRIPYKDGFPCGDPEIVFKFRHPDLQTAAETDVRPQILGEHRVKFKCQALPLKEKLGGIRLLYSHNVQFSRSAIGSTGIGEDSILDMDRMVEIFPVLARVRKEPGEKVALVSETIIEEVLQDIGELDFGEGMVAKTNVAIWRTRGEHRPLIGEFAFQVRFADRKQLAKPALKKMEDFFIALQYAAKDWITLNATKTGVVYRLHGNPPTSHE
ncbi:MAG TPA: hypothetical protein PKU70_02940 [Vicinamibacteria bacterium]|nr:hypothetical protein [Vicinamibacteria bacterium]HRB11941.1 hypothetical protein [Vicinamibacteria bacterium]